MGLTGPFTTRGIFKPMGARMISRTRIEVSWQGFAVIKVIFIFAEVLSMIGSHEDEGIVTN